MTEVDWVRSESPIDLLGFWGQHLGERKQRLLACAFCRQIWQLIDDDKCRVAVEVAEQAAVGAATPMQLQSAWGEARDVARKASWFPAWMAARSATASASGPITCAVLQRVANCAITAAGLSADRDEARDPARSRELDRAWYASKTAARDAASVAARVAQAGLCREVMGNPFRPLSGIESASPDGLEFGAKLDSPRAWMAWGNGIIPCLARIIAQDRDWGRLPVLGDALEDAGCPAEDAIRHCRNEERCPECLGSGFSSPLGSPKSCSRCLGIGWVPLRTNHVLGCWVIDSVLQLD